jgi:lactate permease
VRQSFVFHQLLTPISGSLALSFAVAAVPIVVVLVLLGVLRRPAWQASLAGLIAAFVIAVLGWQFPVQLALSSTANGITFALWPVMWIVFNALLLYNISVVSGRFDAFRDWILQNLPNDRRVVLIVIGYCFGALLEGIAGFGTPIAICSSLLILVGWPALEALTFMLILDTAPVAFGALGVPVTVLSAVTHLPDTTLGAMVGRQLPFIALIVPFYVIGIYGGRRSIAALWPVLLVAGGSFALLEFLASNFADYRLTDILSSLGSLIITIVFLRAWRPAPDPKYALRADLRADAAATGAAATGVAVKAPAWQGWLPWLLVSAVVIVWTFLKVFTFGDMKIPWPGLHNAVFITLYNQPYAAVWDFQPLATGTAILLSAIVTAAVVGVDPRGFVACATRTWGQVWIAVMTVALILEGKEGVVFARTFIHSVALTVMLCVLVVVQQYLIPGIIPRAGITPH